MAVDHTRSPLTASGITMRSDSEQYSAGEEVSMSPPSSGSPVILYRPPTIWGLIRGAAINLFLPFINGMMLGFGELFAHEAAFRLGWGGTKVFLRKHLQMAALFRVPASRWTCHTNLSSRSSRFRGGECTQSVRASSSGSARRTLTRHWTTLPA